MTLLRDVRLALRLLIKGRGFTLAAASTLALGIAVNTAVFTLADAVLFRGVPVQDAHRIVALNMRDASNRETGVSFLDFQDWRGSARSFSSMALMSQLPFNVNEQGRVPDRYWGASVSSAMFQILDERPILGRALNADDDRAGAPPVAVLSYGMWQSRYGGDPAVIGRTINVNDMLTTVVGVMRPGMQFPPNTDLWLALERAPFTRMQGRQGRVFQAVGRLGDGVSIDQARSELTTIAATLAKDYPTTNATTLVPTVSRYNERVLGPQLRLVFYALLGAVGFVLLVACANVANLQLARAADRAKEISIRVSVGASRWRIVQQLLVESVLLAMLGGLMSTPLAYAAIRLADESTRNVGKPYWMTFALDERAFVFFFLVCIVTGIVFGLAPALHVSRTNINDVLKETGRSGGSTSQARRWASALLVAEVAFTVILLAGAGFMMRSFLALYRLDLGIDTSRLLVMHLTLNDRKYPSQDQKRTFLRRLDDRLVLRRELEGSTTASYWPLGGGIDLRLNVDGRGDSGNSAPAVTMVSVGRRYFETIGLRLHEGRDFEDADSLPAQAAAIVNQRFVDLHFPGEDPIGRRIRLTEDAPTGVTLPPLTIVGVAGNLHQRITPNLEPEAIVYVRDLAIPSVGRPTALIVRTGVDIPQVAGALREEVRALDPDIPVVSIQTMDQQLASQRWGFRVFGTMFAAFAVIALVLAAGGLYAVTAYTVRQRTQEIGVRSALGASSAQLMGLFLRRVMVHVGIGLAVGLVGAFAVGQFLSTVIVGAGSRDLATLTGIVGLTLVVATVACLWPASRAARFDPLIAMRGE